MKQSKDQFFSRFTFVLHSLFLLNFLKITPTIIPIIPINPKVVKIPTTSGNKDKPEYNPQAPSVSISQNTFPKNGLVSNVMSANNTKVIPVRVNSVFKFFFMDNNILTFIN